jgi:hypothetical protein
MDNLASAYGVVLNKLELRQTWSMTPRFGRARMRESGRHQARCQLLQNCSRSAASIWRRTKATLLRVVEQFPVKPSGDVQKFVLGDRFVARTGLN